jgi:sigma-B regulation protein RsbU (phosphoserine phosphatase)
MFGWCMWQIMHCDVGMALVKGAVRMSLRSSATRDLADMASHLNGVLTASLEPGMFVTMACVRVERSRAFVTMAGHLPIFWWRAQQRSVERVDNDALPLGVQDDAEFTQREINVAPGDLLVLMTDGFMETANVSGRQLGLAALEAVVARDAQAGAMAVVDGFFAASDAHGRSLDDRTVAVIEIR